MEQNPVDPSRVINADVDMRCLSVHDFVRVDLPFDAVVGAFAHFVTPRLIRRLVAEAWKEESSFVAANVSQAPDPEPSQIDVRLGGQRSRRDAVILSIAWSGSDGGWIPPLDADLEIVGFGPNRTHLHVLGLSQLRSDTTQYSDRASLEHRLAVAVVRHVLFSLARLMAQSSGWEITTLEADTKRSDEGGS